MVLIGMHGRAAARRGARALALCLAALLALAPATVLADEAADDGSQVGAVERQPGEAADPSEGTAPSEPGADGEADPDGSEPPADEAPDGETPDAETPDAETPDDGREIVTFKLGEGARNYSIAQAVVNAVNALRGRTLRPVAPSADESAERPLDALKVDATLQREAFQRAAETSIWLSTRRPNGEATPAGVELRFRGADADLQTVMAGLSGGGQLVRSDFRSIGVGCWELGGERYYVVLLGRDEADTTGTSRLGSEPWQPEVEVDLSGVTSPVLQGRLQASGYRTNLAMVPGSTRSVRFSWVTAPEEAGLATAADLPTVPIDPESFTWTSSDDAVASVSPRGVVTMLGTSVFTPAASREAGADITASLAGTDRRLRFHVSAAVPVYRLYNPASTAHLYTTDPNEYDTLPAHGWSPEGVKWQSVWSSEMDGLRTGTPVYRLLNPSNGDHHFTVDVNEYDALPQYGWRQEGVAYYSGDGDWDPELGGEPVYRIFNAYQTANGGLGAHLWTTDANEYQQLGGGGWTQEGASFYGVRP